jgi:hypothetical protein
LYHIEKHLQRFFIKLIANHFNVILLTWLLYCLKNIFAAYAFISPFNTQTMHIKSYYTQQHCYDSLKTLYPGGIGTRVFSFLRRMRCPLRHAARYFCTVLCSSILNSIVWGVAQWPWLLPFGQRILGSNRHEGVGFSGVIF